MKCKTRDCVRTAPIDALVPRAMWNSATILDISCFWLRKRSGTIGTTGTLERLEPAVAWNVRETCICLVRLPIVFPRLTTCAKYFESKTNRGPSREGPLFRASLRPQLFCEFYLQPVYRAASTRFQQVSFFSAHFHGRCFARPSFLLAMRAGIFRCYD